MMVVTTNDRNLVFARPVVLSAARVKENCFSLSFIPDPSCQTWPRVSTDSFYRDTDSFCRLSVSFGVTPRGGWLASGDRPGNAREVARFCGVKGSPIRA